KEIEEQRGDDHVRLSARALGEPSSPHPAASLTFGGDPPPPGAGDTVSAARAKTNIKSPVRRVERHVLGDLALPAVAVGEQLFLVVVKLLARLGGEFEIRALDDGVDRAGLLAQPAIDAFDHVDVVARGAPRAVVAARAGLDGDGLRRADRLAQLAGDAALLAVGVAAQRVLAAEARRDRPLLEGIVQRRLGLEEIAHAEREPDDELPEKQRLGGSDEPHRALTLLPPKRTRRTG